MKMVAIYTNSKNHGFVFLEKHLLVVIGSILSIVSTPSAVEIGPSRETRTFLLGMIDVIRVNGCSLADSTACALISRPTNCTRSLYR